DDAGIGAVTGLASAAAVCGRIADRVYLCVALLGGAGCRRARDLLPDGAAPPGGTPERSPVRDPQRRRAVLHALRGVVPRTRPQPDSRDAARSECDGRRDAWGARDALGAVEAVFGTRKLAAADAGARNHAAHASTTVARYTARDCVGSPAAE